MALRQSGFTLDEIRSMATDDVYDLLQLVSEDAEAAAKREHKWLQEILTR